MPNTCGTADPKRFAWCVLLPGHPGKHQDSWGKRFAGSEPSCRLADLPRYLTARGDKALAQIVHEEIQKVAVVRASLTAVLHQLEHGEASDLIDVDAEAFPIGTQGAEDDAARRDLQWCREQVREALKSIS